MEKLGRCCLPFVRPNGFSDRGSDRLEHALHSSLPASAVNFSCGPAGTSTLTICRSNFASASKSNWQRFGFLHAGAACNLRAETQGLSKTFSNKFQHCFCGAELLNFPHRAVWARGVAVFFLRKLQLCVAKSIFLQSCGIVLVLCLGSWNLAWLALRQDSASERWLGEIESYCWNDVSKEGGMRRWWLCERKHRRLRAALRKPRIPTVPPRKPETCWDPWRANPTCALEHREVTNRFSA